MYILFEIIDKWEAPEQNVILEISESKEALENLAFLYTKQYNDFVSRIQNGCNILSDIRKKMYTECPQPMLLEQAKIVSPLTKEQQQIRSKIGMENARILAEIEKQRTEVFERELNLLSEFDRECVTICGKDFNIHQYVVEESISRNPSFDQGV